MNTKQRSLYFRDLWPAACAAQGWTLKDDARRRAVTLHATRSESTTGLAEWQITALFTYLRHLGRPDDLDASQQWAACQENPQAYNLNRQGRFWEEKTYGKRPTKLHRDRFKGGIPGKRDCNVTTEKQAADYLMTTRARYKRHVASGAIEPVKPAREPAFQENTTQTADEAVDCPF